MNNKLDKIKRHIIHNVQLMRHFGIGYGGRRLILDIIQGRMNIANKICEKINDTCDLMAKEYLKEKYLYVIKNYDYSDGEECIDEKSKIWILWWQGMELAPKIIKTCVGSIKRNAGKHPVIVLDKDNYSQYIALPQYILDKFEQGKITITHLSDLIRVSLLYQYGGIWMDATLYMTSPFDQEIETFFYSINRRGDKDGIVRLGQWMSSFMASGKGNGIIGILRECLYEYWKNEDVLIVYLWIDFFLTLIYENIEAAREILKNIPISNKDIFEMQKIANLDYSAMESLDKETYIFKLSYKMDYIDYVNGRDTVYHRLTHLVENINNDSINGFL